MNAEYINPFLASIETVMAQVLNEKITTGSLFEKKKNNSKDDVSICIGINGDLKGNVMLNMTKKTAIGIASKMMFGMEVNKLDEMAKSAVAELGNMIAGNSANNFYSIGKKIDITPPILYVDEDVPTFYENTMICIPIQLASECIEINLILN